MGIPLKNRKGKVEKPRPLKICTLGDQSMESVLSEMDLVAQYLNSSTCDRSVYPAIVALCENLKMFGPQLENVYKDQLDRCYISLRNGCRDDRLTLAARYRLLEVIELRAMHWQPNENLINYYKQKLVQIEAEEAALDDHNSDTSGQSTPGVLLTPTGTNPHQQQYPPLTLYQTNISTPQTPQTPQQVPSHPPTPSILGPGEIIRSSGKFAKPTRIPGKNYCKDEVVIRNADSGKVMGIKGRRVHMIEELSETIISFQRVAPGARERLVQITGPAEENINQAKHLIEETIRRNASPVRGDERGSIFTTLGGSSSSISSHTSDETLQGSKRNTLVHSHHHHQSVGGGVGEESLGEYRYTVTRGQHALRITGNNLHLVRTAKLVLDEFFNGERNLNNIAVLLDTDNSSDGAAESPTCHHPKPSGCQVRQPSPPAPHTPNMASDLDPNAESYKGVVTVVRQPLFPSSSKEAIECAESSIKPGDLSSKNRRALFQKTSQDRASDCVGPPSPSSPNSCPFTPDATPPPPARLAYSRAFLVQCAASPLSRLTPSTWSQVVRNTPLVLKKSWQYLSAVVATLNEQGERSINSVPTYLQVSDIEDAEDLAARELRWTLIRTLSTTEDDDNGNTNT
ncbi:hypothetical protein Pcinc_030644 [Petrolisthes cinctipes]|uniref:K Homology domain-containing protein n=1 Tax=Petrolisthes cinctipes TaxID=88211 RepID=A0AAE1EYC9_PETCI|nr:hypothetical protein Pcinc_030644 [Petrolisthes cinctipes]